MCTDYLIYIFIVHTYIFISLKISLKLTALLRFSYFDKILNNTLSYSKHFV